MVNLWSNWGKIALQLTGGVAATTLFLKGVAKYVAQDKATTYQRTIDQNELQQNSQTTQEINDWRVQNYKAKKAKQQMEEFSNQAALERSQFEKEMDQERLEMMERNKIRTEVYEAQKKLQEELNSKE